MNSSQLPATTGRASFCWQQNRLGEPVVQYGPFVMNTRRKSSRRLPITQNGNPGGCLTHGRRPDCQCLAGQRTWAVFVNVLLQQLGLPILAVPTPHDRRQPRGDAWRRPALLSVAVVASVMADVVWRRRAPPRLSRPGGALPPSIIRDPASLQLKSAFCAGGIWSRRGQIRSRVRRWRRLSREPCAWDSWASSLRRPQAGSLAGKAPHGRLDFAIRCWASWLCSAPTVLPL